MDALRQTILDIVMPKSGMTARHLFYRCVSEGAIEKTEENYKTVCRLGVELRRAGIIPYGKIIDGSRLYVRPETYSGIGDALTRTANHYRRSYWATADVALELWCEKDAIRALIEDVTYDLGVPLMVCRGFSSESVVHSLAVSTERSGKPCVILSLNDYDPSGALMLADIIRRARHYAPEAVFVSEQVALTREQVTEHNLPTRPTKIEGNTHARSFDDHESVELDALDPDVLRELVQNAIESWMDPEALERLQVTEYSEREALRHLAYRESN